MFPRATFRKPIFFGAIAAAVFSLSAVLFSFSAYSGGQDAASGEQDSAPVETGIWYDDTKRGAVEISQCGDKLCGHVVWLVKPLADDGRPIWDKYNSDPAKQNRPVCGLQVIGNLARKSDGTLDDGWIYDPKVGSTYSVAINVVNPDELHVRGYLMFKLTGKSLTWTRAPADLGRCDS